VLVWGFFVRTALVLHSTLLVNSAAHLWGGRRYQTGDDARNLGWVALLSLGEGFHNNHHHRPAAANHGFHAAYELDATFLVIAALGAVGLARDLKVYRAGRVQIWFPSGAAR
jgi:stearoyl-CoA desaturase (delta-9 desaturase)